MSSAATTFPAIPAAIARLSKGSLVVSVHDIAPSSRETTGKIVSELSRRGVAVCSLLVVPNYHHAGSLTADREPGIWLRELEGRGNEIVIHGYFHERPRRAHESPREKFITRFYTRDEGEFYDLAYDEALRRITQAREEFAAVGLSPRGFIAPAWLLSAEAERAARDAGMEYTTRLRSVRDLSSRKDFAARSLVYSVQNRWRRVTSLAWNSAAFLAVNQQPLLRLSIHPPDYTYPEIWGQIVRFLDQLLAGRNATTYAAWIDEQRAHVNGYC
jgi:uncharacterized protein